VLTGSLWPDVVERLYFDAATGLLLRRSCTTHVALGGAIEEWFDYSDYQSFGSIKVPRVVTQTTWSIITTVTISNITSGTSGDDARFSKPKSGGGH
jgi:hypothetical protein